MKIENNSDRIHHCCNHCGISLKGQKAFVVNNTWSCEIDFKRKLVPRCEECSDYILGDCINLNGLKWHPQHFYCTRCSQPLKEKLYMHKNNPLCKLCSCEIRRKKCFACGKSISPTHQGLQALGKEWHISCFTCNKCSKPFPDESNFLYINFEPVCFSCLGAD